MFSPTIQKAEGDYCSNLLSHPFLSVLFLLQYVPFLLLLLSLSLPLPLSLSSTIQQKSNALRSTACNHQTVNGSGSDTGREVEERAGGKDVEKEIASEEGGDGRWKEAINMKGKKQEGKEGVMMVVSPEIVQLKVMREVKKVNRMQQVKKRIQSHLLKRLSKRETTVEVDSGEDAIDDAIKRTVKSSTDQLGEKVPSGLPSSLEETLNPQLTSTLGKEVNDRKEIKSLIDVVRFPDEAVDKIVDGIQTRFDSLIPEQVKKMRHDTEAKAVEVLQPIILSASRLFNLNPQSTEGSKIDSSSKESSLSDTLLPPQTLSETLFRPPTLRTQQSNSDSGLSHIFRGVFG